MKYFTITSKVEKIKNVIYIVDVLRFSYLLMEVPDPYWVREVYVDDESRLCDCGNMYKFEGEFSLGERTTIELYYETVDPQIIELDLEDDGNILKYIRNPTDKMCKIACLNDIKSMQYCIARNDNFYIEMCTINGEYLQYIQNQNEAICVAACKNNPQALLYVSIQNEYICKVACAIDGMVLEYVKTQTFDICKIAYKNNRNAINYINSDLLDKILDLY